jgi:hypothetical protein
VTRRKLSEVIISLPMVCTLGILFVLPIIFVLLMSRENNWEANLTRIKAGMTEKEVETRLGRPPGDYSGDVGLLVLPENVRMPGDIALAKEWLGDKLGAKVGFDKDGRVRHCVLGRVVHFKLYSNFNNSGTFVDKVHRFLTGKPWDLRDLKINTIQVP